MNWKPIESITQLEEVNETSTTKAVLIFKHSRSCSISAMALNRLEKSWSDEVNDSLEPYYLDLLSYRELSNHIAATYSVPHESPQALLIKDGKVIYNESHFGIDLEDLLAEAKNKL